MNLPRRTFLSRILAGAVAAPALTRIIEGSTKPKVPKVGTKFTLTIPAGTFATREPGGNVRWSTEYTIPIVDELPDGYGYWHHIRGIIE